MENWGLGQFMDRGYGHRFLGNAIGAAGTAFGGGAIKAAGRYLEGRYNQAPSYKRGRLPRQRRILPAGANRKRVYKRAITSAGRYVQNSRGTARLTGLYGSGAAAPSGKHIDIHHFLYPVRAAASNKPSGVLDAETICKIPSSTWMDAKPQNSRTGNCAVITGISGNVSTYNGAVKFNIVYCRRPAMRLVFVLDRQANGQAPNVNDIYNDMTGNGASPYYPDNVANGYRFQEIFRRDWTAQELGYLPAVFHEGEGAVDHYHRDTVTNVWDFSINDLNIPIEYKNDSTDGALLQRPSNNIIVLMYLDSTESIVDVEYDTGLTPYALLNCRVSFQDSEIY